MSSSKNFLYDDYLNQNKSYENKSKEQAVKLMLNDDILTYINIITYLYLFSDVINFDFKNDKKNKYNNDNSKENIIDFLEYDDIFIYSLILATDLTHLQNVFLQNILNNKNTVDLLLKDKNLITLLKTIYETTYLFYYWYKNLSDNDNVKIEILISCSTLSFDIKKIFFLLNKSGINYDEFKLYYKKIEELLTLKPFNNSNFKNENISDQISLNSYIYDNIRNIFEIYIKIISKLKEIAYINFTNVLYNKNHNPHITLLFSFIKLCKKMNLKFIEFPRRFLKFYFKGVLMFKNKKEIKDKALIFCSLNGNKTKTILHKNTQISGGKDINNKDIIFKVIKDTNISKAKILTIRTICEFIKILNNNIASEYRISEYSMEEVYFKNQFLYLFSNKKNFDNNFLKSKKNKLGYLITSSLFKISSGNVKINIEFFLNNCYLEHLNSILKKLKIKKDNELDYFCKLLKKCIVFRYSSEDKMITIPNENINIKWNKINYSFIFELNIYKKMPKITESSSDYFNENTNNLPIIEILANKNINFWSFLIFFNLNFYKININVDVKECSDLILQNDQNIIENNFHFKIFGSMPEVGSNIYIGNNEIFNKNLNSLKINIEWDNLPNNGFQQYYKNYNKNTKTSDFNISVSFLNNGNWEPIDDINKQKNVLFESDIDEFGNEILKNNTYIDINISKLKLNNLKNINYNTEYLTNSTLNGFLRLQLISPEYGFGHKLYYKMISQTLLAKKDKVLKEFFEKTLNDPFIPIVKSLHLDYSYEEDFFINKNKNNNFSIYKISPFGYVNMNFDDENILINNENILDKNINFSRICIELADLTLSTINLFFYIDESNILHQKNLKYTIGYINNNNFIQFSNTDILINDTENFTKSGILKIKKPTNINENTYLQSENKNNLWIEIRFFEDIKNIPTILNIYINPVYVKRLSNNNSVFLEEKSLTKILNDDSSQISLIQPFQSFNGKKAENDDELYHRISTRLLGKDRCITINDYKNFILENFQEISDVIEVKDNIENNKKPGNINLMVVVNKNIVQQESGDFVKASNILLSNIKDKLRKKCSVFVNINIINPYYEKIKVITRVKFNENYDKDIYSKILNKAICNYISPWMFNKNIKISIIKNISVFNLIKFIKSQKYIKSIIDLHILKNENNTIKYTKNFNEVVYQSYSHSILYSAKQHIINVDENLNQLNNDINIENSAIEENFIIGLEKFSVNDNFEDNNSKLTETIEDNFIAFK